MSVHAVSIVVVRDGRRVYAGGSYVWGGDDKMGLVREQSESQRK